MCLLFQVAELGGYTVIDTLLAIANPALAFDIPSLSALFCYHLFLSLPGLWTHQSGHSSVSNTILEWFLLLLFGFSFFLCNYLNCEI